MSLNPVNKGWCAFFGTLPASNFPSPTPSWQKGQMRLTYSLASILTFHNSTWGLTKGDDTANGLDRRFSGVCGGVA
jgi:hypothetical protein